MISEWLLKRLACPRDGTPLTVVGTNRLRSAGGNEYPVVEGVPVFLLGESEPTIPLAKASFEQAQGEKPRDLGAQDLFLESVGISDAEKSMVAALQLGAAGVVDPVVQGLVGATCGNSYKHLIGKLESYPIPELRLPHSEGDVLIDIGCSWGRWSVAAAWKGYRAIGIDPSLGAALAARRVARDLGAAAEFIVGDARHLPLRPKSVDVAFSYSVIQHFSRSDARLAVGEIGKVLKDGGIALVQLANLFGIRSIQQQARRGFRPPTGFEVRYWTPRQMKREFESRVGPATLSVDCFFGLGLQWSDFNRVRFMNKATLIASEALRRLSAAGVPLTRVADSIYVHSVRRSQNREEITK